MRSQEREEPSGGYDIHVTWAVHGTVPDRVRLVRVYRDDSGRFTYHHQYARPPIPGTAQDLP